MTDETSVCKTEGTFSEAEIVCDHTEVKIGILILCQKLSQKVEFSVEAVIERDLINAPVAPVLNMLDGCRICIKSQCYECILELVFDILDEDRRIQGECLDAHIIERMDESTDLLAHNGIKLILIHRKRIDQIIEGDVAFPAFLHILAELIQREIRDNEELINWLNHNISDYMVTVASHELPAEDSEYIGRLFHVITDLERIGDHALNILERTELAQQGNMNFSQNALQDFQTVYEKALELLDRSIGAFVNMHLSAEEEHALHALEDSIDSATVWAQDTHVERLRKKECSTSSGVLFTKLLQDLERVGDHSYNIAWAARKDKNLIRQI